jgi:glycine C-acetyltransferase
LHNELEDLISATNKTQASVVFPTGYQANIATISTLVGEGDVIINDALNHASLIDGSKLSGATLRTFRHCDLKHLEEVLSGASNFRNRLVIIDAVFSMDGDIAPIPQICQICKDHKATLLVDEAHSLGVLGALGLGVVEHFGLASGDIDIITGVLSKALPGTGGYASGSRAAITYLKENARGYIFSGASAPFQTAVSIAALRFMLEHPERVQRLRTNTAIFHEALQHRGVDIRATKTPITPIVIGDAKQCVLASKAALNAGLHLFAIPFPVVPLGTSRLRASVSAVHLEADLVWAAHELVNIARQFGLKPAAA